MIDNKGGLLLCIHRLLNIRTPEQGNIESCWGLHQLSISLHHVRFPELRCALDNPSNFECEGDVLVQRGFALLCFACLR